MKFICIKLLYTINSQQEWLKHPLLCLIERKASINYAYIANLCVAKSARRQGVATCMLEYAISTAKANGNKLEILNYYCCVYYFTFLNLNIYICL